MEGRKRKHDSGTPRITYHAPGRTFDRLLKEDTLQEIQNVIRIKLGLQSDAVITLQQLRDGSTVDLDDEDDFEAFCSLAHERGSMDVQISLPSQRDDSHPKNGREKTPMRPSSTAVHDHSPAPDENHDEGPVNKKRRVTFEASCPSPDLEAAGDWLKSRLKNTQLFANSDRSDASGSRLVASHGDVIHAEDDTTGAKEPPRTRKRSKSNAGLPSRDSIIAAEPSRKSRKRSKSKTRSTVPSPKEPLSNADGTNFISLDEGDEHVESERDPMNGGAPLAEDNTVNVSSVEQEAPLASDVPPSNADPEPQPTSFPRKSRTLHQLSGEKQGRTTQSDNSRPLTEADDASRMEIAAHASTSRSSGGKKIRKGQPEGITAGHEPLEAHGPSPKEKRLTARDQEIQAVFSKLLAKHAKPVVSTATPQKDETSIGNGQNSTLHVTSPTQTSQVEEPPPPRSTISETDSENSVARALTVPEVSSTVPESKRLSNASSVSSKSSKAVKLNKLPCPVCLETPFHLRYQCPVVLAGPNAVKKRLEELKSKDPERHKELIEELARMITPRGGASGKTPKSNVNTDLSSVPSRSEQQTRSDVSNNAADKSYKKTVTLKGTNDPGKMGANKQPRNKETNNDDSDEESEARTFPFQNPSVSLNSPSFANINLDDIVRGPPITQSSLNRILGDSIDEDADDDTEEEEVKLDEEEEEEEGFDAKLRRLSKRFEKHIPSSDEESEEDESVADNQEMSRTYTGRTEPLSFQVPANGHGTSDVDQPNVSFANSLATVLNAAADDNEGNMEVTASKENEANKDLTHPPMFNSPSSEPTAGRDTAPPTSLTVALQDANNDTQTAQTDTTTPTSPIDDAQPLPLAGKNINRPDDDDPIEPADDFPVIEKRSEPPKKLTAKMKTRNSSKAKLATTAEACRSGAPQVKNNVRARTAKDPTQTANKAQSVHQNQKPTTDSAVDESPRGEISHPSVAKEKRTRSEPKAKQQKTKAEMLAKAVAEKTPRRTRRLVVLVPSVAQRKPTSSPLLDRWTTLSPRDDSSTVDQLPSSSPATQENDLPPIDENAKEDSTATTEPLFLPSESQTQFPYSPRQGDASLQEAQAVDKETGTAASSGSDLNALQMKRPFQRRSSVSYRSLSDIAKAKTLFPAPAALPAVSSSQRSVGNKLDSLFGKLGEAVMHEEEEGSDSDSSEDDKASHIPKARLAGVKAKAIRR